MLCEKSTETSCSVSRFRGTIFLTLPNQMARHLWFLLVLGVCFYCDPSHAKWCSSSKLTLQTWREPCLEARAKLHTEGWSLDKLKTSAYNHWPNNSNDIMDNVNKGEGDCFLYKMVQKNITSCCSNWTGPNCDIAVCDPPCQHGTCNTTYHTCDCDTDYGGSACDENTKTTNVTIITPSPEPTFRTCMSSADCRYRTFDGLPYTYCSTCNVTMVQNEHVIVTSAAECDPFDKCDCLKMVTIKLLSPAPGEKVVYFNGTITLYNGLQDGPKQASLDVGNLTTIVNFGSVVDVHMIGGSLYVRVHRLGLTIRIDGDLFITLNNSHGLGEITGMCGDFDYDYNDEIQYLNNNEAQRLGETFTTTPYGTMLGTCLSEEEVEEAHQACAIIKSRTFEQCHRVPDIDELYYLGYCMRSYCSSKRVGEEKGRQAVCKATAAYAAECAENHVVVYWRSASFCPNNTRHEFA